MKKAWSLLCAVLLAANLTAVLPTAAAESVDETGDAVILSTGLITNHYVSVSNSTSIGAGNSNSYSNSVLFLADFDRSGSIDAVDTALIYSNLT